MAKYYVNENTQSNGDHEVHKDGCSYMPVYKKSLGDFSDCKDFTEVSHTLISLRYGI